MGEIIQVKDEENGVVIQMDANALYSPAVPVQDQAYKETTIYNINGEDKQVSFTFPSKPTEPYQLEMWETLKKFENTAWAPSNTGVKTGYDCIDKAFDGGLYPGFIVVAGDSNLGKTAFMTNLAWNIIKNNTNVYVMDFSLDDSINDKLSRIIACSGQIIVNAVKTPSRYTNYPVMLTRRKKAMSEFYNLTDRYIAYDASKTTFVEDIEETILHQLIYFDEKKDDRKLVVLIDNFHDMDIRESPNLSSKDKFDALAQWCSDCSAKHNIIIVCAAELKKLNSTRRPQLDDLRETVKIKYAAKAVILVYNEVHYKGESSNVYYSINNNPYKQPILEIHFAKNKYGTYKGRNFFQFYPDMAYVKECDQQTQKTYTNVVYG